MANLVIDVGNSRTKIAVFIDHELIYSQTLNILKIEDIEEVFTKFKIKNSIVSSVSSEASMLEEVLINRSNYIRFSASHQNLVNLTYTTPQTLGLDRLAAIIAASKIYPNQNCLVIDAGTCITYDVVSSSKVFSGGSISPGLNMRFHAMHTLTGRLPLVNTDNDFSLWQGTDTISSILSGVQNGACFEVDGFIKTYQSRYNDLKILLCGGDAKFFDTRLKSSIFAHTFKMEPNLVLIGLNEVIYQYND
ncbi:MAG: type III pantothenate kinase [Flavobacterium sp.]|nr:type III pantothenate kinase [Pedobacter sp.]